MRAAVGSRSSGFSRASGGLVVATMLALAACADPLPASTGRVSSAILGGQLDPDHAAVMGVTHFVGADKAVICTGTVVHVQNGSALLLTASHCLVALDDALEVKLPVTPLRPADIKITPSMNMDSDLLLGRAYQAVAVAVPAGYDGHEGNPDDIALVRFVGATPALPQLPTLPTDRPQPQVASPVTLVGFGQTEQADQSGVRRSTSKMVGWMNANFIGFDQTDGHGICHGDSGGPVLVTDGDHQAVAAVNSLGSGTAEAPCGRAGTSIRVARAGDLMKTMVGNIPPALDCGSCASAEQAPGNACAADSSCTGPCADYVACVNGCTDVGCSLGCRAAQAAGAEQYATLQAAARTCASDRCKDACETGGGCSYVPAGSNQRPGVPGSWILIAALALLAWRRRVDQ
jgi:MYXO-CTERM domain-containing protein